MTIILLVPNGLPFAEAHFPVCTSSTLQNDELYVSAAQGFLFKVKGDDGHACLVGKIVTSLGVGAAGLTCDDIAIDHTDGKLYCLGNGNALFEVSRTPTATPEVLATPIGPLLLGVTQINTVNALEISSNGVAYATSGANDAQLFGTSTGGKLFTVDLTSGALTEIADFTDKFRSSGDLALNEQAQPRDLFWTVKCRIPQVPDGMGGTMNPPGFTPIDCGSQNNDALFRIDLEGPTLVFVADLGERDIFAMEYIATGSDNLCYLTMQGLIFETDLSGTRISGAGENFPTGTGTTFVQGTGGTVPAFGATANFVGGSLIMIDTIALVVAGIETNAAWLILFMLSAVGVVAYQFTGKTNSKKRKNIS